MSVRRIGIGVVGCGLMGREFGSAAARWMHLLDQPVAPRLVAACDVNPAARKWFADHFGPLAVDTADAADVFRSPEVEVVYVAVPHNLHADLYVGALEAGKHLFAEKPFGIDLAAAGRIAAAAKARPGSFVRCSSEFPFFPACQRLIRMIRESAFGRIIEAEAGFLHSSDLDPNKAINWKRRVATCGEYGVMGDLGLHVLHVPLRFGWVPRSVHAVLSKIVVRRPDGEGGTAPCETWDNARLTCRVAGPEGEFPLVLRTERIAPGETDTWYLEVRGTRAAARFTTKRPRTFSYLEYTPGGEQAWKSVDVGYETQFKAITGHIFEFGFPDAILQMWAAYLNELNGAKVAFGCATPDEAFMSHRIFTAALTSHRDRTEVAL